MTEEQVNHPAHYGGADNPYEAIKVIESWRLGFCLGNAVKYLSRAGKKDRTKFIEDMEKAVWYIARELAKAPIQHHASLMGFATDYTPLRVAASWDIGVNLAAAVCDIARSELLRQQSVEWKISLEDAITAIQTEINIQKGTCHAAS